MKDFLSKISITKLVFLIMVCVMCYQAIYLTLNGVETSLFNNAVLSVIAFYFGQKVGEVKSDPLIENDKEDGQSN